jgi:hypothetical protein
MRKTALIGLTLVVAGSVAFGLASLASGASRRSATVAPVANESFCYAANSSPGKGGAGWNGGWAGIDALVNSTGLSFSGFPKPGGSCSPDNSLGPAGAASSRALSAPVSAATGTSVILRALIRSNDDGTPTSQATLGNDKGGGTLVIGDQAQSDANAGNWGIQVNGGALYYSTVPVQKGVTTALTVEVDFQAGITPGNYDRVKFWVQTSGPYCDPAVSSCVPALAVDAPAMSAFSGLFWQTQKAGALVDEISVDKITPAPAPTQICVVKFEDKNGNGVQDAGESNLSGWTFTVKDSGGNVVGTLTSGTSPVCLTVQPGSTRLLKPSRQNGFRPTGHPQERRP